MPIGSDTFAYRGDLPHLVNRDRTYFVTFCSKRRTILPPPVRTIVLASCVHEHSATCWLDCVTVMPDHVHLIIAPHDRWSLATVVGRMKGRASRLANRFMVRSGLLWQRESFDHIVRSDESVARKREYIFDNPVRAGIVESSDRYAWSWSSAG